MKSSRTAKVCPLYNLVCVSASSCPADAFLYVFGSAGNCSADHWNRSELEKWRIVPRMLRDATVRNLKVRARYLTLLTSD